MKQDSRAKCFGSSIFSVGEIYAFVALLPPSPQPSPQGEGDYRPPSAPRALPTRSVLARLPLLGERAGVRGTETAGKQKGFLPHLDPKSPRKQFFLTIIFQLFAVVGAIHNLS